MYAAPQQHYLRRNILGMGGWKKKREEGKPHEGHSFQKQVLDPPPPRLVCFPPVSGVVALFFLYRNPRLGTPEALLEGSENHSERSVVWYVFLPPYVLHPPHIMAQINFRLFSFMYSTALQEITLGKLEFCV